MTWETKTWPQMSADDVFAVMKLRTDVFFLEQQITEEELDQDDKNPGTIHIWAEVEPGVAVAYARVVRKTPPPPDDLGIGLSIGRLVVDAQYRGVGLGHDLMRRALHHCGEESVVLHAQAWVKELYSQHGFVTVGEPFDEAGIVHLRMVRSGGTV